MPWAYPYLTYPRSNFNCIFEDTINTCKLIRSKKSLQFLPIEWLPVTVMLSLAVTGGLSVHTQVVRTGEHNSTKPASEKKSENWFKSAAFYNDFLENFHQMSIEQHHKCILVIRLWENWNFILLEIIFKVLNLNQKYIQHKTSNKDIYFLTHPKWCEQILWWFNWGLSLNESLEWVNSIRENIFAVDRDKPGPLLYYDRN